MYRLRRERDSEAAPLRAMSGSSEEILRRRIVAAGSLIQQKVNLRHEGEVACAPQPRFAVLVPDVDVATCVQKRCDYRFRLLSHNRYMIWRESFSARFSNPFRHR
jgi:hypothetical protein